MTKVIQVPNLKIDAQPRVIQTASGAALINGKPAMLGGQVMLPDQFTLSGTVLSTEATTLFNMNDSYGYNVAFGYNVGANSQQFSLGGGAPLAAFIEQLKSFVPIIEYVNYESTIDGAQNQNQFRNPVRIITTNYLGQTDTYLITVKKFQRNTQNQRDILTYYAPNDDLAITPFSSIGVVTSPPPAPGGGAVAAKLVELTFAVRQWIPINEYLNRSKINPVNQS